MATVKKAMVKKAAKAASKMMKKAAPMMQAPMMGGGPMMKKGGKLKKAQAGTSTPKKKAVDSVRSEMFPGKMIPKSKSNIENNNIGKMAQAVNPPKKKMKSGGGFPDLNKDGKITQKDILIGKGVLPKTAKKGMKVKMAQAGKTVKQSNADMMKAIEVREKRIAARDSANQRKSYTNERANKVIGKNKMGGKTKKCMYGCK